MKLVIVESPAKAKTIERYLGKDYKVMASIGHIRDLPKNKNKAVDIEAGFVPHYEIVKGKEKIIKGLKTGAKKADEIILATDPDREGEAIAWHLVQALGLNAKTDKSQTPQKTKRVIFHEITERAIKEAFEHPRAIDKDLVKAQEARRVLDRLVGYDLSGLIWKKVRYGLSAGRVQSPALRILMEREREIRAFKPEDFWVITADLETVKKEKIQFACKEEPRQEKEAQKIIEAGKRGPWQVKDVKETENRRSARAPFITSTLQQVASSRLGFSPANTMRLAQRLYEAGRITYMRTDSPNISKTANEQIAKLIKDKFGERYLAAKEYKTKSKVAQEAHEAIRPTRIETEEAGGSAAEKKLYRLIWQRALASQMADAKIKKTKIVANITDNSVPNFEANGQRIIFDGWLAADPAARGEEVELPEVKAGEPLKLIDISSEAKETQPPNRYTEAGLVKELEKRGIGRPSTYASIVETLLERGYVKKEARALLPTDTGDVVSSFLEQNFANYVGDTFTAEMENELDEIAAGERQYEKTLGEFYKPFSKEVKAKEKEAGKITNLGEAPAEIKCPKCGAAMIIKLGRSGKFYSCSRFPSCSGARTIEGEEMKGPEETGEACPECGAEHGGKLVKRQGRYGEFIACSRYPRCKYVKTDEAEEARRKTGVVCPVCGTGEMVEKRGRYGVFYGCSNYPKCKNIIKAKPTGNLCPLCDSLIMQGTKTIPDRCSNKECPMHNPHKLEKK